MGTVRTLHAYVVVVSKNTSHFVGRLLKQSHHDERMPEALSYFAVAVRQNAFDANGVDDAVHLMKLLWRVLRINQFSRMLVK